MTMMMEEFKKLLNIKLIYSDVCIFGRNRVVINFTFFCLKNSFFVFTISEAEKEIFTKNLLISVSSFKSYLRLRMRSKKRERKFEEKHNFLSWLFL